MIILLQNLTNRQNNKLRVVPKLEGKVSMKKLSVIGLLLSVTLIASGCSNSSNSSEGFNDTISPTATISPTPQPTNLKSAEFDSEDSFWECAEKEFTVDFKDVREGKYEFQFIVVDGIIATCQPLSNDGDEIELIVGYKINDEYEFFKDTFNISRTDIRYGKEALKSLRPNDTVRICSYIIRSSSVDFNHLIGIKITGHQDNFIEDYIAKSKTSTVTPTPYSSENPDNANSVSHVPSHIEFGTLIDANPNGGANGTTLVIKAKIEPNLTNEMTIRQNYHNIIDIVKNQGCTQYDAIDYWAVADMSNGSEGKVISFLVDKNCIDGIVDESIAATTLEQYLKDLWILPSLQE